VSTFLEDHPPQDWANEQLLSVNRGGGTEVVAMSEPTEADRLGELFRCERYLTLFPSGMPKRACLRRQLERLSATDTRGKPAPIAAWPAAKPFCAMECQLGVTNLEDLRRAGVPLATCPKCGAAQVGAGQAAACPGCLPDEKLVPPKRPPAKAEMSARIWSGEALDVPIGAPGRPRPQPEDRPPAAPRPPREERDQH
jgi:endogenous inhibitor of DNA gyrase (YacG/DUF329 family)